MNKQLLNNQVDDNDFADELSDEALDRAADTNFGTGVPGGCQ